MHVLHHFPATDPLAACQTEDGLGLAKAFLDLLPRTSLNRSTMMMNHLLPAVLEVWIDHVADEDWGMMCYPPVG